MTASEAPNEEAGTQDREPASRAWLKPLLIVLGILGGLALNGLVTGLVCHFTVTVPMVRALDKARLAGEAKVDAKAKELGEVVRAIASPPTAPTEPAPAVEDPPPAAVAAPVPPGNPKPARSPRPPEAAPVPATPAQARPVTRALPMRKVKPDPGSHPSQAQPPPADPNK